MTVYEVDIRNRKDGNSIKTIISTSDYDKAWEYFYNWYDKHSQIKIILEENNWDVNCLIDPNNNDKDVFVDIYCKEI